MKESENLKNDDQLLSMMEEMQDQIEELEKNLQAQIEINSEQQKTISELSSEKLILKSEVQKKSETIISQNEQIEKLSESDLVLKRNEKLEKENTRLQNLVKITKEEAGAKVEVAKKMAQEDINSIRNDYAVKVSGLNERQDAVGRRETLVSTRENNLNAEIRNKATNMVRAEIDALASVASNQRKQLQEAYATKNNKLQRKYKQLKAGYRGVVFVNLFYSIITTILTAIKTEVIGNDFKAFIKAICGAIQTLFLWSIDAGTFVAKLGDMIPNMVVGNIVHWMLLVIVSVGIVGGAGVLIFIVAKKYVKYFKEKQMDEISVYVGLLIFAFILFVADFIKSIVSINLIVVAIVIFVGYTVVRGIIQSENTEVKKQIIKRTTITVGGIGVFVVVVHFFGAIGIIAVTIGGLLAVSES